MITCGLWLSCPRLAVWSLLSDRAARPPGWLFNVHFKLVEMKLNQKTPFLICPGHLSRAQEARVARGSWLLTWIAQRESIFRTAAESPFRQSWKGVSASHSNRCVCRSESSCRLLQSLWRAHANPSSPGAPPWLPPWFAKLCA